MKYKGRSSEMTRSLCLLAALGGVCYALAQGGDNAALRAQADALFTQEKFAEAMPHYAQLVSLDPSDHDLNYRLGTCVIHSGADKEPAIGFLNYALKNAHIPPLAWYYLGRAYHLTYHFKDALVAYQHFRGTEDKKALATHPVDALEQQCRNGMDLLNNLKEVTVLNKVEVDDNEFFRFYDLSAVGGRIVVTPDELRTALDRKTGDRSLTYLPDKGGRIYFSSYGKDGATGRDIYSTTLLPEGAFDEPLKLAGYINTDQDEDFAFLAPDGKAFYFCSKGHNSMGGYDVFRSSYDAGLDVYGPPVNLDFAVNTPDDDIFYMVDAEGKEACFASARDSKQGMIHVYRVATAQQPLIITVIQGTFASAIDALDRKAHIVVEDAVTHEQVADVRTDINGEYLMSLPRNGRYKFMVQAGPGGKTHVGMVDVPRSDDPRAYRQELSLMQQDGQERLLIRNYFEEPLSADLIDLALEEIKRRAKLDVTTTAPIVQASIEEPPPDDVMTAAGFTGDVTKAEAVRLAEQDATELEQQAGDLDAMSGAAYGEAVAAMAEADAAAVDAGRYVSEANATGDEEEKNRMMMSAAEARQRSQRAVLRASAALRTGKDLGGEHLAVAGQARGARRLAGELSSSLKGTNTGEQLEDLRQLKSRLDEKRRPESDLPPEERARRAAAASELEATKELAKANGKRAEEDELIDHINRLERELEQTRGSGRRQQLEREIEEYQGYQAAMHEEVEAAFGRARELESEASLARAQASLMQHLATSGTNAASTDLDPAQIAALQEKIASTEESLAALPIDPRFDAMVLAQESPTERAEYGWELADARSGTEDRQATITGGRDEQGQAEHAEAHKTTVVQGTLDDQDLRDAEVTEVPVSSDGPDRITRVADASGGQDTRPQDDEGSGRTATTTAQEGDGGRSSGVGAVGTQAPADGDERGATPTEIASTADGDQVFLLENELAETRQLRSAARTRAQRDSLDARIAGIEQRIAAAEATPDPAVEERPIALEQDVLASPEATVPLLAFDRSMTDDAILDEIFTSYEADRSHIAAIADLDERNASMNGLELMAVDSISAQTSAQLAELEAHPDQADQILPRVDRLRVMKEEHLSAADDALAASIRVLPRQADVEDERLVSAQTAVGLPRPVAEPASSTRYIELDNDPQMVYASRMEHRSEKVDEAVEGNAGTLEEIATLTEGIDSLEILLAEMPAGKAYDKLRQKADRMIDDRLILRMEMGQRMEYISREEFRAGMDSLGTVRTAVMKAGLAPSEPLLVMARQLEETAQQRFNDALALRKKADRSEDIVMRDSLFRQAYAAELVALRELDRAITVNNYVLSEHFKKGAAPEYALIESELFELPVTATADRSAIARAATTGTGDDDSGPEGAGTVESIDARGTEQTALPTVGTEEMSTGPGTTSRTAPPVVTVHEETDLRAPASDRSRQLYGAFIGQDQQQTTRLMTDVDAEQLALQARMADAESQELEDRSLQLADRALAISDSAATVKKRDREGLEQEAIRVQQLSDSLHRASLAHADSARVFEQLARDAEEAQAYQEGLKKFYYLSAEEQALVVNEADHSRYFQAKVKALQQQEDAAVASQSAAATRQLWTVLQQEASKLSTGSGGEQPLAEAQQRSVEIEARIVRLRHRADSLDGVAARLNAAADLNDGQAASILEVLPAETSSSIMALEQATRRTEPFLAEAHSIAGEGLVDLKTLVAGAQRVSSEPREIAQATAASAPATAAPGSAQAGEPGARTDDRPELLRPRTRFSAPEVLTADIFEMRAAGSRTSAPIGVDQPKPAGIVFSVQIGAFRNPIPTDLFGDVIPVMGESAGNGLTRYTAGLFSEYNAADDARLMVRDRGYRDAFVVAYRDGVRISLAEALRSQRQAVPVAQEIPDRTVQPSVARESATTVTMQERPTAAIQRPSELGTATRTDEQVLADYPATAEEIVKQFTPSPEATAYYNDPSAAPARQVETVKGLFFTVQVGVYSKPVQLDKLFNIDPLNTERTETGKIRYTTGVYLDTERARIRKDETVGLGVKDAFVTAYLNGRRIPMVEARALLAKHGTAILADPSLSTR